MSKYGFNENEVKRTIVDMIDKDGFHKETVYDGKYEFGTVAPFGAAGISDAGEGNIDDVNYYHTLIVVNVPDNSDFYASVHEADAEYELNVGDTMPTGDVSFSMLSGMRFPDIRAFYGVNPYTLDHWHRGDFYYNIYSVDHDTGVINDRTKGKVVID